MKPKKIMKTKSEKPNKKGREELARHQFRYDRHRILNVLRRVEMQISVGWACGTGSRLIEGIMHRCLSSALWYCATPPLDIFYPGQGHSLKKRQIRNLTEAYLLASVNDLKIDGPLYYDRAECDGAGSIIERVCPLFRLKWISLAGFNDKQDSKRPVLRAIQKTIDLVESL